MRKLLTLMRTAASPARSNDRAVEEPLGFRRLFCLGLAEALLAGLDQGNRFRDASGLRFGLLGLRDPLGVLFAVGRGEGVEDGSGFGVVIEGLLEFGGDVGGSLGFVDGELDLDVVAWLDVGGSAKLLRDHHPVGTVAFGNQGVAEGMAVERAGDGDEAAAAEDFMDVERWVDAAPRAFGADGAESGFEGLLHDWR